MSDGARITYINQKGGGVGLEESLRRALAEARAGSTAADTPDWEPLERVLPAEHCAGFMWMGLAPGGIRLYKPGLTRRYLNLYLDPSGEVLAYRYSRNDYVRMPLSEAIDEASAGIETLAGVYRSDPRATPYDHENRALRDRRLCELGWTVISVSTGSTLTRCKPAGVGAQLRGASFGDCLRPAQRQRLRSFAVWRCP